MLRLILFLFFYSLTFTLSSSRPTSLRCNCSAATPSTKKSYKITLLPGDGIGPEVVSVAKDVLLLIGSLHGIKLEFQEKLLGGAAIDATGLPLPDDTLSVSKQSHAILLGAIGGYKWDKNEKHLKPDTGLLQLREGLQVFANLRPATVFPQLVDASTLKREIAEGVDLMVVRELTGGIYFGKPRGFNTEIYAAHEIDRIARVAFNIAREHGGKLCSVDKANVLEASMLWRKRVTALAQEYHDVEISHMYVDNVAMSYNNTMLNIHGRFEPLPPPLFLFNYHQYLHLCFFSMASTNPFGASSSASSMPFGAPSIASVTAITSASSSTLTLSGFLSDTVSFIHRLCALSDAWSIISH